MTCSSKDGQHCYHRRCTGIACWHTGPCPTKCCWCGASPESAHGPFHPWQAPITIFNNGHYCGLCGQWVNPGISHYCSTCYTRPATQTQLGGTVVWNKPR